MDAASFWELINKTREAAGGDPRKQHDLLINELAQLPENEILSFDEIFRDLMDEAYAAELWEAAYVIDCGCSDDGFSSWREWLIGRGKVVFYKALADPESLTDIVEVGGENVYPTLLGVTFSAYERVTGKDMLPPRSMPLPELKGESSRDEEAMKAKFPKLTEKYWNWWMKHFGVDQS